MSPLRKLSSRAALTLPFLLGVLCLLNTATPIHAATFTVTSKADNGSGTLRKTIANANSGDVIRFNVSGTITLTSGELLINKNLKVTGPGASKLTISGNDSSRVFHIGSSKTVTISNLTIANGRISVDNSKGGGILNSGKLALNNCAISGNGIEGNNYQGDGIYNDGTLTITNCTVSDNGFKLDFIDGFGGGIYNTGTLTVTNTTVSNNRVGADLSQSTGGGIYNTGTLTVTNCTISSNFSQIEDGGIANEGGAANVSNSTISHNDVVAGSGGVGNRVGGMMTFTNCTISDNLSEERGPGGIANNGTMTLNNCTISGNEAGGGGDGGIVNAGLSTMTINNCTISGNVGYDTEFGPGGGGIWNFGTLTVNSSTITGNSTAGDGGGIYNEDMATLSNSIIAGNGDDADVFGALTSQGYNIIGDVSDATITPTTGDQFGTSAAPIDPRLEPLADNGGPTQTHALQPDSPAIDQGNSDENTDQRGVARPQGTADDIGAFELEQTPAAGSVELTVDSDFSGNTATLVYRLQNNSNATLTSVVVKGDIGDFFGNNYTLKVSVGKTSVKVLNPRSGERRVTWNNFTLRAGDDAKLTLTVKLPSGSSGKTIASNWKATFKTTGNGVLTKKPETVKVP
jgi:Right handed beta helix region